MDLTNLNASDLTNTNLGDFFNELEAALSGSDYDRVKKAIYLLNSFLVTPGVIDVDAAGTNRMDISAGGTTESVDIDAIAENIVERVKNDKDTHDLTPGSAEEAKREEVVNEMNKYLTSIFNQNELMRELASRGFSIDEFYRQMSRLNDESKATIEDLKKQQDDKRKVFESVFGGDSTIKTGDYLSKAYTTRVKDCQEAVASLEMAKTELTRLKQAREDRAVEIDAGRQMALDNDIARHEANLGMLADKVKALNIPGIDAAFFTGWEEEAKIDASISAIDGVKHVGDVELNKNYSNLKQKVAALSDIDKDKLGITAEIEEKFSKVDDLDPDVRKDARAAIDKYMISIQRSVDNDIQRKIAIEERMIALRDENVQKYREVEAKMAEFRSRVDLKKESGHIVLRDKRKIDETTGKYELDANGDYVIELDENGDPMIEAEFDEITDRAKRNYYLQKGGFNREQALAVIDKKSITRKEIRARLKAEKVGNPVSRFFAPKLLWKRSRARAGLLREMENECIELEARKEYNEIIPEKRKINFMTHIFERAKNSAAVQHVLYSAGKEQGYDSSAVDKSGVIDDLERAAYEEAFSRGASIGADEITEIRKEKGDTHEKLVKRHVRGSQTSASDLIHRDDNNDMEL